MNLFASFRSFFYRSRMSGEMDAELRSHIEHRADDLERSGMARAEARRRAAVEFGGVVRYQQESREQMSGHFVESFGQDVRFGLRMLRKAPGFTFTAVFTLALAIGANAVVFSMLNELVLRPVNVPNNKGLVLIEQGKDGYPQQSYPDYLDLRDRTHSFDGMAMASIAPVGLDTGGKATSAWVTEASGNYFDMLGVEPYLGRFFHMADEHGFNSSPYIVLNYGYWRNRFSADPNVIGRVVEVNKHPYTVLGVAPDGFRGTELFFLPDFWVPLVNQEQIEGYNSLNNRTGRGMWIVGHIRPGVQTAQAASDVNAVAAYLAKTYPKDDDGVSYKLAQPGLMGDMIGGPVRAFLAGLMLLAGLILLAACANLGSLFAARAADRSREVALRLALGSSRGRILRQLLTEAVMIALMGGTLGLLGSVVLLRWLSAWHPVTGFPVNVPVNPDGRVYLVALLLALASGLLFGLVPVRQVLKTDPYQTVKAGSAASLSRRITARDCLLVLQIVVCAVLVTASLVAVRGMMLSLKSNFGFVSQGAMVVGTDLDMAGYSGARTPQMQRRLLDAVAAIPGVTSVGLTDRVPLSLGWATSTVFKDSTTDLRPGNNAAESMQYNISPGYFQAAGTTLLAGRNFNWHDDAGTPRVAIVNREFARRVIGSTENAVGGYFKIMEGTRIQIVGLVEDGKYRSLTEDQQPAAFFPILQSPTSSTWLIVRSGRDPQQLARVIETTLRGMDEGLPFDIQTLNRAMDSALLGARAAMVSLGVLGVMGSMLALTGVFGMASYSVSKRLRELGIRIALGAQRREVLTAALGRTLWVMAIGSVLGLGLGVAASRFLAFVVYQATPGDPVVLGGVVAAMLLLGIVATWVPAARALRADPMMLLREE
jgi:predicted permease